MRFRFDSETCLNNPFLERFLSVGNLKPKLKWFQANIFSIESPPSPESNHVCSDCGNTFKSRGSLWSHKRDKHSEVKAVHPCPFCAKPFTRKTNLDVHLDFYHYGKKAFCLYCDETFASRAMKNRHIRKAHGNMCEREDVPDGEKTEGKMHKEAADVETTEATETEIKENTEREAMEATEKEALEATEKEALEATIAETLKDSEKDNLEATEKDAFGAAESDVFEAIENEIIDQEKTCDKISVRRPKFSKSEAGGVYYCQEPECPMVKTAFESGYSIRMHFYDNHLREEEKIFVCEYCLKRFALRTALNKHVKLAHEKRHVCEHCGARFGSKYKLQRHVYTHTGEKPYGCDKCDYRTAKEYNLEQHRQSKHKDFGDKRHHCELCGKGFVKQGMLLQHKKNIHRGEGPKLVAEEDKIEAGENVCREAVEEEKKVTSESES